MVVRVIIKCTTRESVPESLEPLHLSLVQCLNFGHQDKVWTLSVI